MLFFCHQLLSTAFHLLLLLRLICSDALDISDFLVKGDRALSKNDVKEAIVNYSEGIKLLPNQWTVQEEVIANDDVPDEKEMEQIMSLHTNYATALSFLEGSSMNVVNAYRTACICYRKWKRLSSDPDDKPKKVAVQAFFYLAMSYQDLASSGGKETEEYLQQSVKAYAAATKLDPNHWSSYANMGVVLADVGLDGDGNNAASLQLYEEGIMSYQRSINLLIGSKDGGNSKPTDPPDDANKIVAELQYRIGLCLVPFLFVATTNDGIEDYNSKLCDIPDVATGRSCFELAAYQFHTALQYDPDHDGALNALTLVTADATFGMSTDVSKVEQLFEEYASR